MTISVKENTEESIPATRATTYYCFHNYEYDSSAYFDRAVTCLGSCGNIVTTPLDNGMGQRNVIWQFVALGEVIESYVEMDDNERIAATTENSDSFSGDVEWSIYTNDGGAMHFIYNIKSVFLYGADLVHKHFSFFGRSSGSSIAVGCG